MRNQESRYHVLGLIPRRASPTRVYDTRYRRHLIAQANKLGFRDKSNSSPDWQACIDYQTPQMTRYSSGKNKRKLEKTLPKAAESEFSSGRLSSEMDAEPQTEKSQNSQMTLGATTRSQRALILSKPSEALENRLNSIKSSRSGQNFTTMLSSADTEAPKFVSRSTRATRLSAVQDQK